MRLPDIYAIPSEVEIKVRVAGLTKGFGDNEVQLGGLDTPYRFRIIVERATET